MKKIKIEHIFMLIGGLELEVSKDKELFLILESVPVIGQKCTGELKRSVSKKERVSAGRDEFLFSEKTNAKEFVLLNKQCAFSGLKLVSTKDFQPITLLDIELTEGQYYSVTFDNLKDEQRFLVYTESANTILFPYGQKSDTLDDFIEPLLLTEEGAANQIANEILEVTNGLRETPCRFMYALEKMNNFQKEHFKEQSVLYSKIPH
ncbi:MAG: hypothetical protein WCO58_03035 [bacterium]